MRNWLLSASAGQRLSGIIPEEKHHTFKLRHDWLLGRSPLSLSLLCCNWKFVLSTQFLTTGWSSGINISQHSTKNQINDWNISDIERIYLLCFYIWWSSGVEKHEACNCSSMAASAGYFCRKQQFKSEEENTGRANYHIEYIALPPLSSTSKLIDYVPFGLFAIRMNDATLSKKAANWF